MKSSILFYSEPDLVRSGSSLKNLRSHDWISYSGEYRTATCLFHGSMFTQAGVTHVCAACGLLVSVVGCPSPALRNCLEDMVDSVMSS